MNEHDFGQRLRQLRHARGETLEQVSAETGLSVAMLSRVERGERLPSPESVEALAEHFGLPVDDLMSDTIASRMFNRYGAETSSRAAEKMTGAPREVHPKPTEQVAPGSLADEYSEALDVIGLRAPGVSQAPTVPRLNVSAPAARAASPDVMRSAAPARSPMRQAGMAFSARPIEDLFPEDSALDALADAARVAEVALVSAIAAARRAMASGDPRLEAEGERVLERLRESLEGR